MKVKGITDECITDYKRTSMYIAFPYCTFKCDKENGCALCQNSALIQEIDIDIEPEELIERYINNPLTSAIICGGLEPIDSWDDLQDFLTIARKHTQDTIIIYTGYTEDELKDGRLEALKKYKNIIIKFGRFRPYQDSHYDEILGVNLCSSNQYAKEFL